MTRDEIEDALLTGGAVDMDAGNGASIVLESPKGRRLADVVFRHLQSSTVDELSKDAVFFGALEATFTEALDETEPDSTTRDEAGETKTGPESRSWRIKKIETQGFGGLNSVFGDVFEFDAAGQDFCIEGQNGSGKSSLANAVLFAMTGKVHRDQFGLWSDPERSESVMSNEGKKIGDWPPIAAYPASWAANHPPVDISVKLTFGNETDDEEIEAKRRLHGQPGALEEEVFIDPRLTAVRTLIEAGLLMPMRVQHIRVPESDDNNQLVGLIRQLIGLEPLLDVANLVEKLAHRGQRFLKYARDNNSDGKSESISRLLVEAQEEIAELRTGLNLAVEIRTNKAIPDDSLKKLDEANKVLDRRQADGFAALAELAFEGFDAKESKHRQRVTNAVNHLHTDASRQKDSRNLPPVLNGIANLAQWVGKEEFDSLRMALQRASNDLSDAIRWAGKQKEDRLLRLKATAAAHFVDRDEPVCPLCEQSIKDASYLSLVEDLRTLKSDAKAAQTTLVDACLRIERDVRRAAQIVIPAELMQIQRYEVKRDIQNHVKTVFAEASHVIDVLPGFSEVAQRAVDAALGEVEEVEFGSDLSEPEDGDDVSRVRRLLGHLDDTIKAAVNWQPTRQVFRDAWTRLFSKDEEGSLTARIIGLERMIRVVEPFRSASEKVEEALKTAAHYNEIVRRQAEREEIVDALKPLRKLRDLVNITTRQTIDDVSEIAKDFHEKVYSPELLVYEKAELSEFRGKQTLSFQAKLGNDRNWRIDASLLANVSWMRGILWAFLFAIRKRAINRAGCCPFSLIVLDDPQMTFDSRNLKGWVRFLGTSEGLRTHQPCQLLVTTHSRPFALEMMAMPDIRMAAIETGQPWFKPVQVVEGDFAGVRFAKMIAENSDDRARSLIADIRVLAETLLKHAIEPFEPTFVTEPDATFGRIVDRIAQRNVAGQAPYTDRVFGDLIAVRSSYPDQFSLLSEPHHTVSETITVREAQQVYEFWRLKLFPSVRKVWEEYRFLQKSIVGEVAAIPLPDNCNHIPLRSISLSAAQPTILGRVAAYSDGRAASAIRIDNLDDRDAIDLSARAAYCLDKDTLSPVALVGDILLTRLDSKCRAPNLIVEDRGTHRVARRWLEYVDAPALAVLAASSSNPREVPPAIISRAKGANRRKIVGILFAADKLGLGERANPDNEATELEADNGIVAELIADTDVFEVQGSSAEPIALDKQYLLAKRATDDLARALREYDGRPVIAEDSEGCAYFKRLRVLDLRSVVLESLDKTGVEELVLLSIDPQGSAPLLVRVRLVVGVIFDKV